MRDRPRTVEELASALDLTDNAVRAQLAALERDDMVEHLGVRRTGATRPAHTYGVVPEAEALFSKAYVPLLSRTLEVLSERIGSRKLEALMHAAGRRLTPVDARRPHGRASRLAAAAEFLNELGGRAHVERTRSPSLIRSGSCPVGAVAKMRPEVCMAMAGLVGALVEAPARPRCERENGRARCLFEIGAGRVAPLLLVLLATTAGADTLARVDELVRAEMAREKVPGVAVAIVDRGEVVKAEGYGMANVEHEVPVRPDTVFQSGSVGKQFTAATVMTLVEEGRIGLDDSIAKYFPEAPEAFRAITVRHLLTHTSGIPDYTEGTIDLRRDYGEDELARMAFGLQLEFVPGSRWNYSNTGYLMLGILVRRASGRFYGDLLRERIFVPLGMKTARIISEEDIVPHRAAGYRLVDGTLKNQEWVAPKLNTTADGSLYFTVLDLIAWDRGLRARAVLGPESWAAIFRPVRLASGKPFPYGFGWSIEEAGGRPLVEHGGSWQGFKTHIARYLGNDLTIIVLANLAEAEPERFVRGIAAIFDPTLAPPAPGPIADREPEVTARLRTLLAAARDGRLSPDEFAYVRAGFFPEAPRRYAELLRGLGEPRRVDLLERRELGDDRVYRYAVAYEGGRALRVRLGVAPDGKLSALQIAPE